MKNQIAEIKKIQTNLPASIKEIEAIQAKLAEIEGVAPAVDIALAALRKQKQDVQAEVSLGKGNPAELDRINREINEVQAKDEDARHTLEGLQRKLVVAQGEHENLQGRYRALSLGIIQSIAQKTHDEFLSLARELLTRFEELQVLTMFHRATTGGQDTIGSGSEHQYLMIPHFRLESAGEANGPEWEPARQVHHRGRPTEEAKQAVVRKLADYGVIV